MTEELPGLIGRYKILSELGRGGFGRVYRGHDPTVGRPVAIKVLTQVSEDSRSRFRNEAVVAGNLGHRNIVTVYEYGTHGDLPFLAMEYLEGRDLYQIIASGTPLTLLKKCSIMSEVAEGLHCAHQSGVVHRDMKPGNIMVLRDGTVKIMDFGIARLTGTQDATRLTQQGYLIGTLRYMAPEQLAGTTSDALCDIFAYGVVYYELLTGRHPFEAADAQNLMYKLTFEEPPPLREFAPDVPDALQEVMSRIIHKDRAKRYQSLQEVQFDTEPIRIDLQHAHVGSLLAQARGLMEQRDFEPAQNVVREALALDPSNRTARLLREELRQLLQRSAVQPRMESAMREGDEHLAQRRFLEAVKTFEHALTLDPGNSTVQARIEQARALAEHARKASQLLAEARKELEDRNVTGAYRSVSMALRHDPKNPDAAEFLKTIQAYVEDRQAEQRIEDAIRKAQGLILIPSYDEAIATLTSALREADSPRVRELLERVRQEKQVYDRRQKLRGEIAKATDLLRDQRIQEASRLLDGLAAEFPDDQEVQQLLSYTRKEQAALARARAVERVTGEARSRVGTGDFDGALAELDRALQEFPGESALIRLLSTTLAQKDAWERRRAIESIAAECERLRAAESFAEAAQKLRAALEAYPGEAALVGLLQKVEAGLTEQRNREIIRQFCRQAESLLAQDQAERALGLARQALARYPGDVELSGLVRRTQEAVHAQEQSRRIAEVVAQAAKHAAANEFAQALQILDRGLRTWPNHPELTRQRAVIGEAKERAGAIERVAAEARQRADAGDYQAALALLDRALERWADAAALRETRAATVEGADRAEKRGEALRHLEEIRLASLRVSEASEAARLLSFATGIAAEYTGDRPVLQAAAEPIGLLSDYGRARGEVDQRRFSGAIQICERRLTQHPGHPAFAGLKSEAERGLRRAKVVECQQKAAAEPDLQKRRTLLEAALGQYAGEEAIEDELRITRNKLALIESIAERARRCEQSGEWSGAIEQWRSLGAIYERYPGLEANIERCRKGPVAEPVAPVETRRPAPLRKAAILAGSAVVLAGGFFAFRTPPATGEVPVKATALPPASIQVLQVDANFESGEVSVDGHPAGPLKDGRYRISGIEPGRHRLRVRGKGAEFEAEWNAAPGAIPELQGTHSGKDVQATIVASAGGNARIACNCGSQPIVVDGTPAAQTTSGATPVDVKGLQEGTRQIAIGEHSVAVDIGANPALYVTLAVDRNEGTLLVRTGEDGTRVYLNQRLYRRSTEHGLLRIPIEPGQYSVRIEKDGYTASNPQTVALKRGEEKSLSFVLTPAPAVLEIAGAIGGAQVRLDGQPVGETDRSGAFRHPVAPGTHGIELSKEEYTPVRLTGQFASGKTVPLGRSQVAMAKAPKTALPDPRQIEAQEWAQVAGSSNPEDFETFLRNHPSGPHAEQARTRAGDLRQAAQANTARQAEQTAWSRVDPNNREQLQNHLSHYPSGVHAQEARARIVELERQAADAAAAQRVKEQKEAEQARAASEEQAIATVLRDFEAAYNRRDLAGIQRIWEEVPAAAYRQQFREAADLSFQLSRIGPAEVNGNSATVGCMRTLTYRGRSGGPQTHSERVSVLLMREGSGWRIRSIRAK